QAGALLADPLGHAGLRTLPYQQLDIALAEGQHGEARLADLLLVLQRQAERVAQEVDGLLERGHGDRDVLDPLDLHAPISFTGLPAVRGPSRPWRPRTTG